MKAREIIVPLALLAFACLPALAADEAEVEGTVEIGIHVTDTEDANARVAEYEARDDDVRPDLAVELFGHSADRYGWLKVDVQDEMTHRVDGEIRLGPYFQNRFHYDSLYHRYAVDMLDALEVRELEDPEENKPGGKMLTHDTEDLCQDLGVRVTDLRNELELTLPFAPGTTLSASYHHLARVGFEQANSINHCANCHVVGRRVPVDEQTEETRLALTTSFSRIRAHYSYTMDEYSNDAVTPRNHYDHAEHPVTGESDEEFASRCIYEDETLTYARDPDSESATHRIKLDVDLGETQNLVFSLLSSNRENLDSNLDLDTLYGAVRYDLLAWKKAYFGATFARQELESDDVRIDLPAWREGREGGGQDFDWIRESVYDRVETLASLAGQYRLSRTQRVKLDYRYRSVDRESYELGYDDTTTQTDQHRIRMALDSRWSPRIRTRLMGDFERIDHPFVNPTGIDELPSQYNPALPGNSFYFYFQRQRVGEVTNQPTESHGGSFNLTFQIAPRTNLNVQTLYRGNANDELNTYEWESSTLTASANLNVIPSDRVIFTFGANHSTMESEALLSVPVMDG